MISYQVGEGLLRHLQAQYILDLYSRNDRLIGCIEVNKVSLESDAWSVDSDGRITVLAQYAAMLIINQGI